MVALRYDSWGMPRVSLHPYEVMKFFYYGSVSSPNDMEIAFENCVDTQRIENQKTERSNGRQLRYMMHQLMIHGLPSIDMNMSNQFSFVVSD